MSLIIESIVSAASANSDPLLTVQHNGGRIAAIGKRRYITTLTLVVG